MRCLSSFALSLSVLLAPALAAAQTADIRTCQRMEGDRAVAACTRLIDSGKFKRRDQLYELYSFRGGAFAKGGKHKRAVADFTRAIERDKNRPRAFINRAESRVLLDNFDGAIKDYTAVLAVTSNKEFRKGALNNRGFRYSRKGDLDKAIADFDAAIALDADYVDALRNRGDLHRQRGVHELAIKDYGRLIELNPRTAFYYDRRADVRVAMGDLDGAIVDLTAAIKYTRGSAREMLVARAALYFKMSQYERAIRDYTRLIDIDPKFAAFYEARGWCHYLRGRYRLAIEDAGKAITLGGKKANNYHTRGDAYRALGKFDEAIADFNRALAAEPRHFDSTAGRGEAFEERGASGDRANAIKDYRAALALSTRSGRQKSKQAEMASRLAALQAPPPPVPAPRPVVAVRPQPPDAELLPKVVLGRRVALLIGNADYKFLSDLRNPVNDATAMDEVLRKQLKFDEVILALNLSKERFATVLLDFSRKAAGAGLALFYYAGHATEDKGENFLIPVDANPEKSADLELVTISLDTVQEQLQGATKLKLVILDSCRTSVLTRGLTRGARGTRGLARPKAGRNSLVVYAAKEGTVALDGVPGSMHSPFTAALLKRIATPGLEVGYLFRLVHDDVLAATNDQREPQEPHTYGTVGGVRIYLHP